MTDLKNKGTHLPEGLEEELGPAKGVEWPQERWLRYHLIVVSGLGVRVGIWGLGI